METNEKNTALEGKRPYQTPEIQDHGSVEKLTEQPVLGAGSIISGNV